MRVIAVNVKTNCVPNWLMVQHLTLRLTKFIRTVRKAHFQPKRKQNFLCIRKQKTKKEDERKKTRKCAEDKIKVNLTLCTSRKLWRSECINLPILKLGNKLGWVVKLHAPTTLPRHPFNMKLGLYVWRRRKISCPCRPSNYEILGCPAFSLVADRLSYTGSQKAREWEGRDYVRCKRHGRHRLMEFILSSVHRHWHATTRPIPCWPQHAFFLVPYIVPR